MKMLPFLLMMLPVLAFSRGNSRMRMEHRAREVTCAMERCDLALLDALASPGSGFIILYAPGVVDHIYTRDAVSNFGPCYPLPADWAQHYFGDIDLRDMKINYGSLPGYDCNEDRWEKRSGIYCDTTRVTHSISALALDHNEYFNGTWTEEEIAAFRKMEESSREFVVIGESGHFIFYLTRYNDDWWLSAVRLYDPCSA